MAQPQVRAQPGVKILELGNVAFFYRPKKGVLHPTSPDDLERAFFMMFPDDQKKHKNRLINVAHGIFPEIIPGTARPSERDWAFVDAVSHDPRAVVDALEKNVAAPPGPSEQRARPYARVAGDGRYAIVRHEKHTDFAYFLHEPARLGTVQKQLEIKSEATYVISVKDPFVPSEIQLDQTPSYPPDLRSKFDGHSWIPCEPTSFLDYRWTQILLIGGRTDVERDLGFKLNIAEENQAAQEALDFLRQEDKEAVQRWHVDILEPLLRGQWV